MNEKNVIISIEIIKDKSLHEMITLEFER